MRTKLRAGGLVHDVIAQASGISVRRSVSGNSESNAGRPAANLIYTAQSRVAVDAQDGTERGIFLHEYLALLRDDGRIDIDGS